MPSKLTTDMISLMNFGTRLHRFSPIERGSVVALPETTDAFSNAVTWVMRSDVSWRDLLPDYGNLNSIFVRFRRLAKACFWEKQATNLADCPDLEWVIIDASHIKVHQHGMGAPGESGMQREPKEV